MGRVEKAPRHLNAVSGVMYLQPLITVYGNDD
jgi:hypothetical protein